MNPNNKDRFMHLALQYRRKPANPYETYIPGDKEIQSLIPQQYNIQHIY
jgi:hypothetical protein